MFGILDKARQFAKQAKEYITSIVGGDNETKSAKSTKSDSPNCVLNPENKTVDVPEDKFEKKTVDDTKTTTKTDNKTSKQVKHNKSEQKVNNIVSDEDIEKIGKEIDKLKAQYSITDDEYYNIILQRSGYSKNQFMLLNNNQKMEVLLTIRGAMKLFSSDKYMNNPDIDSAELIASAYDDLVLAQKVGQVKTVQEFDKATKKYISKINRDFKSAKTNDEKAEVLLQNRLEFENDIENQRIAELKLCKTSAERSAVNEKYDARVKSFEGYFQSRFIAHNGKPENAYVSTYLRNADDMADGYNRAVKSFSCEARSCAAGTFTHGNRIKQAQRYAELGNPISATTYGAATKIVTQYMNKADLEAYEKDAYTFKKEYYKNPDKYKNFITEEHLTQEAVSLAVGATLNKNLSSSEKAAFLKAWNEHAQEFSDYDTVRGSYYSAIKEYISKHPEVKKLIDEIKVKIKEQFGDNPDIPRSAQKRYDSAVISRTGHKSNINHNLSMPKATPQQLEKALVASSYDEVRRQYSKNSDRDFAEVVLHNPKLKNHKQNIVGFIKSLSAEDLSNLTKGCSTDMFLFVLRNISPDKAGRLYDLSKGEKCYAARKLGEKIVEENRVNEAA